jgi:hypothetical protein
LEEGVETATQKGEKTHLEIDDVFETSLFNFGLNDGSFPFDNIF